MVDFEKAQDDLRNAELAHDHAVADAELFDERLAFELRASEFEVGRQELLVADLRRQVDELSILSPVDGIVGDLLVDQKAAVSTELNRPENASASTRLLRRRTGRPSSRCCPSSRSSAAPMPASRA